MVENDIQESIVEAKTKNRVLELLGRAEEILMRAKNNPITKPSLKTIQHYKDVVNRIFLATQGSGVSVAPTNAEAVIEYVRTAETIATLRMSAQALKPISTYMLREKYKEVRSAIKEKNWENAEKITTDPSFSALLTLSSMTAADYSIDWTPIAKRKSKKASLINLEMDWREQLARALPEGHFTFPALAQLLTGSRPAEIERGIKFIRIGDRLRVRIRSVKVTDEAGQPWRCFDVADHFIKYLLLEYMDNEPNPNILFARVKNGNSLTTHIRSIGRKLWPKRKEAITCYSARHAMAADCKLAIQNGADPDITSQVLGHCVDKTQTYYGSLLQAGGVSMAPTNVRVSRPVKNKQKVKNSLRKAPGQLKKNKVKKVR